MKRGEVWWASLPSPAGRRPVLLLSRDRAYQVRNAATVAFLSTTVRGIPTEVPLSERDGVPKACAVNLDVINTIPLSLLSSRICVLSPAKLSQVDAAIRFALDLA